MKNIDFGKCVAISILVGLPISFFWVSISALGSFGIFVGLIAILFMILLIGIITWLYNSAL